MHVWGAQGHSHMMQQSMHGLQTKRHDTNQNAGSMLSRQGISSACQVQNLQYVHYVHELAQAMDCKAVLKDALPPAGHSAGGQGV